MDLNLMRSLVAVADTGAITEAGNQLGLTQPALTRRIQQLESEFGAQLLSRSRKGAELTALGKRVEREARVLIDRYDTLKKEIADHEDASIGSVRIGGGATAVSFVLPNAIANFQREFPGVRFHVKEASSSEIASNVADGQLDLGLVTQPLRTAGLEINPLVDDDIVLVAAANNPLANRRTLDVAELDGQNFVGFEGGSAIRQLVDASLREAGVEINVIMELRSIPAILRMVVTTDSLAFVSQLGVAGQTLVSELETKDLTISRRLGLARRKGEKLSQVTEQFAQRLQDQVNSNLLSAQ